MNYYDIPADFKKESIDKYEAINKTYNDSKIFETYGNLTVGNCFGSGRPTNLLPDVNIDDLYDYIRYSKQKGINFNYTINASWTREKEFTREGVREIHDFLGRIYDAGVRALTIALPSLVELVRASGYDFEIKASVLCSITNPNKAIAFKKMGVDRIVVDESVNRNFHILKKIIEHFGEKVEIIVNTICYKNCIYRMFHYDQMSAVTQLYSNETSASYYRHRCLLQRFDRIDNLLKLGWVRPEDIKYYNKIGVKYFKLQGRQAVFTGDPIKTIHHYFQLDYDGNLLELLNMFESFNNFKVYLDNKKLDGFLEPFYKIENFCKNECPRCGYCENFAKKCIDFDEAKEIIHLAHEFYNDFDPYKQIMAKAMQSRAKIKKTSAPSTYKDDGDFAF
jgi:collagenase-like PrtC family protease